MEQFPKDDDLDLAADAIVRLQELYGDITDFTLPRENNSKYFRALRCLFCSIQIHV